METEQCLVRVANPQQTAGGLQTRLNVGDAWEMRGRLQLILLTFFHHFPVSVVLSLLVIQLVALFKLAGKGGGEVGEEVVAEHLAYAHEQADAHAAALEYVVDIGAFAWYHVGKP